MNACVNTAIKKIVLFPFFRESIYILIKLFSSFSSKFCSQSSLKWYVRKRRPSLNAETWKCVDMRKYHKKISSFVSIIFLMCVMSLFSYFFAFGSCLKSPSAFLIVRFLRTSRPYGTLNTCNSLGFAVI